MKIQFPKIKKTFKKKNAFIKPDLFWKVILNFGFVLVLLAFVFGFYNFIRIQKSLDSTASNSESSGSIIRQDRLDKAIEYFSERKNKSEEILLGPPPIVDPSL